MDADDVPLCPGIDETPGLKSDGSVRLTDVHRDGPAATRDIACSWTSEGKGHVRWLASHD